MFYNKGRTQEKAVLWKESRNDKVILFVQLFL